VSDETQPQSSLVLYQTEDGRTRIQCRFENETVWLTQAQIAELFQTTPQNVTLHLKAILAEGELSEAATCKDYLQVRAEGGREVSRNLRHYRLEAILAVGYRVRSQRGTQFRQWATARLSEYLVKGFTMDDERLKNPPTATRLWNKAQGWTEARGPTLGNERPIYSSTPTGLRPVAATGRGGVTQPRWGCDRFATVTQGSSFLATLGFETESRWDSRREVTS
jgi:hypothetical protein